MQDTMTMQMARDRVAQNRFQGQYKRVLCVCSAGILRSPTLAWILSNEPYNCNTRACGTEAEYALIPIDASLVQWADYVVFVNQSNHWDAEDALSIPANKTFVLNVPDDFEYRDPELIATIRHELERVQFPVAARTETANSTAK